MLSSGLDGDRKIAPETIVPKTISQKQSRLAVRLIANIKPIANNAFGAVFRYNPIQRFNPRL